jgi:NADPH-dependent ferric siderophore reductase
MANAISQMTPRQTADELFNRVMTAADNGDAATRDQFLPTALKAYEAAQPLDLDGIFHVALLHGAASDWAASLEAANEILSVEPGHLLGLVAAARAALGAGRQEEAGGYYRLILDNYDAEAARPLQEYQTHSRVLTAAREEARAFLGEG